MLFVFGRRGNSGVRPLLLEDSRQGMLCGTATQDPGSKANLGHPRI
jgi:hypothetical protein